MNLGNLRFVFLDIKETYTPDWDLQKSLYIIICKRLSAKF